MGLGDRVPKELAPSRDIDMKAPFLTTDISPRGSLSVLTTWWLTSPRQRPQSLLWLNLSSHTPSLPLYLVGYTSLSVGKDQTRQEVVHWSHLWGWLPTTPLPISNFQITGFQGWNVFTQSKIHILQTRRILTAVPGPQEPNPKQSFALMRPRGQVGARNSPTLTSLLTAMASSQSGNCHLNVTQK